MAIWNATMASAKFCGDLLAKIWIVMITTLEFGCKQNKISIFIMMEKPLVIWP